MFNVISKVVELTKGPEAALAREFPRTERFKELARKLGKNFPYGNYDKAYWPLPYYQMVSREEALNHCPDCGSLLIFQEGCLLCQSCGYSKCG